MLHILWIIIKIILFILLGILGLVLLILLLLLFAPIRYKVHAQYKEKAHIKAKVRFLFVTLYVEFSQEEKKLDKIIRIAGIRLGGKDKHNKDSKNKKKETKVKIKTKSKSKKELKSTSKSDDKVTHKSDIKQSVKVESEMVGNKEANYKLDLEIEEKPEADSILEEKEDDTNDSEDKSYVDETMNEATDEAVNEAANESVDGTVNEEYDLWDNDDEEEKESFGEKIKKLAKKAGEIWTKLSEVSVIDFLDEKSEAIEKKYSKLEKKINRYLKFWNLQCTVKTRKYLGKYLLSLLKHISPRKVKGYVHYGFGDPCKTGEITGYLSLMPIVYQKHFSLQPDFYEKVIDLDLELKGRIHLGYILRIVLKPYIWKTIKVVKKLK